MLKRKGSNNVKQVQCVRYLLRSTAQIPHHPARKSPSRRLMAVLALSLFSILATPASAQSNLLQGGWQLDREASSLRFQSIKNGSKVETSSFANFDGTLDENGVATLLVELNSVDTKVDLRNVRMRFLFFETFRFPVASITARVEAETLDRLASRKRINLPVEFELDLHGVTQTLNADTVLTLFTDDQIAITSESPITIMAEQFELMEGILKLQEAADVEIVPSGSVSFDLIFKRNQSAGGGTEGSTATAKAQEQSTPGATKVASSSALESSGDFSVEECITRFDTLSRTGAINFAFASSEIDPVSYPLLQTLVDIIQRCPSLRIVVGGHTDSSGPDASNMVLSTARAQSVERYLLDAAVSPERIRAVGFGESKPLVPNDTRRNRARNRRIEFTIDNN